MGKSRSSPQKFVKKIVKFRWLYFACMFILLFAFEDVFLPVFSKDRLVEVQQNQHVSINELMVKKEKPRAVTKELRITVRRNNNNMERVETEWEKPSGIVAFQGQGQKPPTEVKETLAVEQQEESIKVEQPSTVEQQQLVEIEHSSVVQEQDLVKAKGSPTIEQQELATGGEPSATMQQPETTMEQELEESSPEKTSSNSFQTTRAQVAPAREIYSNFQMDRQLITQGDQSNMQVVKKWDGWRKSKHTRRTVFVQISKIPAESELGDAHTRLQILSRFGIQ